MNTEELVLAAHNLLHVHSKMGYPTKIVIGFTTYVYLYINDEEFQFYRVGDMPTNYLVKDLKEAIT